MELERLDLKREKDGGGKRQKERGPKKCGEGGPGEPLCYVSQMAGDSARCQEGVWRKLEGGTRGIWKEFGMVCKPYIM